MASRSAFGRERNNTMPGASRTQQKAEARYNVTTQFPQYDLHFAAASGNLGLVEFALSHGQPINSVLNGVLPLHAACAGGSEVVVKYLIDEGADVNAPRIPRRYSNEKHKSSGLAVGASGSTPLHFAAANGHMGVVRLLLAHGAVPDRADKHGVTPEMLARENGWVECADTLAAWSGGRSGDLPPVQPGREDSSGSGFASTSGPGDKNATIGNEVGKTNGRERDGCEIAELIQSGSRRLQMKRSIDNALHLFRAPLLHHHSSHGQLRERDKSPPSPSAAVHPHSLTNSIFPLHSHQHSHSHGGSPSHSHLHALFHHGHSHSTSHLQSQPQSVSQPQPQFQSQTASQSVGTSGVNSNTSPSSSQRALGEYTFRPSLSTGSTSSNLYPNPLDYLGVGAGVPGNRRPSLPHIYNEPASPFQRRLSGRKRRPRSAGSDAGQGVNNPNVNAGNPSSSGNVIPNGNGSVISGNGVNGGRLGGGGTLPNGYSSGYPNSNVDTSNTRTITARKLSSKISLRNLFRRAGGDASANATSNVGSEPGSGTGSASTSFSNSSAPIYHHSLANAGARGASSPTPPASPLSASFTSSPSPMAGGTARPGSWYRSRMGSESANSFTVPRSPLVPPTAELPPSQEHIHEDSEPENDEDDVRAAEGDVPVVAPRLHARPSILRGHNRSSSSQSSSGTGTPSGTRTLRFDASSSSASPEPRWATGTGTPNANANSSAIRLRATRSASSLRHEHSYGSDEEEEEEDYGTSINPPDSGTSDMLDFDDAGLDESPAAEAGSYKYASTGRGRGASFASTASSSSGPPENGNNAYEHEHKEFPFSIDRPPPLTPISMTSEASGTTQYNLSDDSTAADTTERVKSGEEGEVTRKRDVESRARGESFSSEETDRSERSQSGASSTAVTNITTPSPGTDLRISTGLSGDDNDTEVPAHIAKNEVRPSTDGVYLHGSPSSSLEDLDSSNVDAQANNGQKKSMTPTTPTPIPLDLDLKGISNLAEAEALVRRAQQAILASASLPADGPESPGIPLAAQLAAYGEILALERRFARGEKQREMWAMRDDSDGDGEGDPNTNTNFQSEKVDLKNPQSAKEARMALTQKKRDVAALRQRGATTDAVGMVAGGGGSSVRQRGTPKAPKHKRPHTAEGAPQAGASWGFNSSSATGTTSKTGADPETENVSNVNVNVTPGTSPSGHSQSHSRSTSTPLYVSKDSEKLAGISIIETTATPVESPAISPDGEGAKASSSLPTSISATATVPSPSDADQDTYDSYPYSSTHTHTRYTLDETRPTLPFRSRTPDPIPSPSGSTDELGFVPLTRVATAPLQDAHGIGGGSGSGSGSGSYNARGSTSALRSNPATRRTGAAHKLAKMGFSVHHSHSHSPSSHSHHHHHHSHSQSQSHQSTPQGHHFRKVTPKGLGQLGQGQDGGFSGSIGPGSGSGAGSVSSSSPGSSRSPSKARFGVVKSLVRGLTGK